MKQDPIKGDIYTYFGGIGNARRAVSERMGKDVAAPLFSRTLTNKERTPQMVRIRDCLLKLIAEQKAKESK